MKLHIEKLTSLYLIAVLLLWGCAGCGQKTALKGIEPQKNNSNRSNIQQHSKLQDNPSLEQIVHKRNSNEKIPPNDKWTIIYSALIPKGTTPPDEYYGDLLYWIPSANYETIVNVDGSRKSKVILPDAEEKRDRVRIALDKLKVEYKEKGERPPEAENYQISVEIWTDGLSALDSAKLLAKWGGLAEEYVLEFAQKALDENPNDFHTLFVWSSLLDFSGKSFNHEKANRAEAGYRRLIEMNPISVPVLHRLGSHLYLERELKTDPDQSITESIALLKKSVNMDPTYLNGSSLYNLAKVYYFGVRDIAKAIKTLKRLNTLFPSGHIQKIISTLEEGKRWPPMTA